MRNVINKLSFELIDYLKDADELYVAVALMNNEGLKLIQDNIKPSSKEFYLIGIDLPSEPKALEKLNKLSHSKGVNVKIFSDVKRYFHPKVYLIRKSGKYIAFIGSGNCTNGGLNSNIEMSFRVENQEDCIEIKSWFFELFDVATVLNEDFIEKYQISYLKRLEREKSEIKSAQNEKKTLNQLNEANFLRKEELIRKLKKYRASSDYKNKIIERDSNIKDLRRTLDYSNFKNIDIDAFFGIWELGHLISIAKPAIKRNYKKLQDLLVWLCNENISIEERYEEAINGKYKVEGVSKAFISKVLVIHNSELYYVKNNKIENALRKFGLQVPKGLSEGQKYKVVCDFLREICLETGIENLAVLDYYLYLEG